MSDPTGIGEAEVTERHMAEFHRKKSPMEDQQPSTQRSPEC